MVTGKRRLISFLFTAAGIIAIEITNPFGGGGISGNGYMALVGLSVAYFGGDAIKAKYNGKTDSS